MPNDFHLENTRRELIALRVKFGADSPEGHRCSNLIEQIQAMETVEGEQRAHLQKAIARSIKELNAGA